MKASFLSLILLLLLAGCASEATNEPDQSAIKHSTESAEQAIAIAKDIANGYTVAEDKWEKLFNSSGYKNYLIYSNASAQQEAIKEAIISVFDPERREELDSLLHLTLQMDQNYFKLSLIRNINGLKNHLNKAEVFLNTTDFDALIAAADSLTRSYLPSSIQDSLPKLYDIHIIISDPDAKVMEDAIVIDLNAAFQQGREGLIKLIAHEYHHNYRKLTTKSYDHPLMVQLNKIHQEGIADMIDKDPPPIEEMGLYPKSIINTYNADYENTPENLSTLDTLTNQFLRKEMDAETYDEKLNNYFKFGGHTTGIYMALKIAKGLNKEVLIDSYNDPVAFIDAYNKVAQDSPGDHVFSPEFMAYIALLNE